MNAGKKLGKSQVSPVRLREIPGRRVPDRLARVWSVRYLHGSLKM
ncbi:hypothetical protein HMPREF0573_11131 [Mobiluncus curtisii ATCC 43063]|uniref:Uncharacterized protein n=1 Tax=Mobiluncus curtisii (strain ATCC 43063 / DSM 2711 / V125) TaxID=548479 RepID=D6ZL51_MOBCV|nr:hypothetical protein HMPREF0573_11131 [Mobiluncus curtisii ATCC 43063]